MIIISGLMLKSLGSQGYADWQYAYTLVTIFTTLTWFFGAELLTPMLFELNDEDRSRYISTFLWVKIIFCVFLSIVSVFVGLNIDSKLSSRFVVCFSLLFLLREPLMTGYSVLQFERRVDFVSKTSIVVLIVKLALIYLILQTDVYVDFLALPWLVEGLLLSGTVFYFSKIKLQKINILINPEKLKKLLVDGLVVWVTIVLSILYFKVDKIFLKGVAAPDDYVSYAASSQLNENFLSLSTMIIQIVAPYYIYSSKDGRSIHFKLMLSIVFLGLVLLALAELVSVFSMNISFLIFKQDQLSFYLPKLIFLLPLFGVDGLINSYLFKLRSIKIMILKLFVMFSSMLLATIVVSVFVDRLIAQVISLYIGIGFSIIFGLIASIKTYPWNKCAY